VEQLAIVEMFLPLALASGSLDIATLPTLGLSNGRAISSCSLAGPKRRHTSFRLWLLALNWDVHDVPLPIDQQERQIGWLNRVGQSLKHVEVGNRLTIELQHHVAWLET
jgi:hypothetical protein